MDKSKNEITPSTYNSQELDIFSLHHNRSIEEIYSNA